MSRIKTLIILTVAALCLAIVAGCEWPDEFMPDAQLRQTYLEDGRFVRTAVGTETLRELLPVIRLDTFDGAGERLHKMFQKPHGGIRTVFLKGLDKAPAGGLINGGILIEMLSCSVTDKAGGGDKFHIDLDAFPWMAHLFVGFGDIRNTGGMISATAETKKAANLLERLTASWYGE